MLTEYPLPTVFQAYPALELIARAAPAFTDSVQKVQSDAREFGSRYVAPVALDVDTRIGVEPEFFPWDVVQRAGEYRFLSFILPRIIGGGGHSLMEGAVLMEEVCAHCAGIGNVIGVNMLGLAPIAAGGYDMNKYYLFLQDTLRRERSEHPTLWAWALTEPEAGSDLWDLDEMSKASGVTTARRDVDGYVINGCKCFISNGSVAKYISTYAALDKDNPRESMTGFVVPTDTPGFSVVRVEHKMGQRAAKAAELSFNELKIPATYRLGPERTGASQLDLTSSMSHGVVGAIGVGIARGALQRVWSYAANKVVGDHRLIDEQWVQMTLADMIAQIAAARQACFVATILSDLHNPIFGPAICGRVSPRKAVDTIVRACVDINLVRTMATTRPINQTITNFFLEKDTPGVHEVQRLRSALAATAKVLGSDAGMAVSASALEIAGADGSRRELGLEKCFRDAKVVQIYEGTNEINRIRIFKKASGLPETA